MDTVGAIVAWEIESGDDDGMFAIAANSDPSTATLSVARPDLDFEYAPHTYTLDLVAVDDAGNRSLPQAVIVNVTDDLSEPAEISISDSTGNRLVNNGTFDFGVVNDDLSDPASSSTSQTFTVRNHGNADLTLDPSSNVVPAGFQFSGVTPSNVVAPGATAQLRLRSLRRLLEPSMTRSKSQTTMPMTAPSVSTLSLQLTRPIAHLRCSPQTNFL